MRCASLVGDETLDRREHSIEELSDRLAAQEPRLVGDDAPEGVDELMLECVGRDLRQTPAAELREFRPALGLDVWCDDGRGLERARESARQHPIELDAGQRLGSRRSPARCLPR